jgi:aspartate carbamoyltransferase catalytic subunit
VHVDGQGGNSSAAKKGESLEDTIRCLESYVDVTVLRHPIQGSVESVIALATKPVINAGDGIGEHPTQVWSKQVALFVLRLPIIHHKIRFSA